MRPSHLPPAAILAKRHKHGHKMRYMAGCRCWRCRRGNAAYERKMQEDRKRLGPNDLVGVERVRAHVQYLRSFGMGPKTIGKIARASKTGIREILYYGKAHIRRRTEARILAVMPTLDNLPKITRVSAADTVDKIRQLAAWGYPFAIIARDGLGQRGPGLQVPALKGKTKTVCAKTAIRIRDLFARVVEARENWQRKHGPIPRRHYVYWTGSRLVLRPFHVNYDYQHLYPKELKQAILAANKLKRTIRRTRKHG